MIYRSLLAFVLALVMGVTAACSEAPQEQGTLTFDQIHGTGLAAICPEVNESARGRIDLASGQTLKLTEVCLQPVRFDVEEEKRNGEKEFVATKSFILSGATLGPAKAEVTATPAGLTFNVTDGMTTQPTTVQLPRREQVPMLFSVSNLKALAEGSGNSVNPSTDFEGDFVVPGYRASTFLDPRGRGTETGYESAVGLQASQDDFPEGSAKVDKFTEGHISIQVARVDPDAGEVGGNFVSYQMSSDEQGTLEPHRVRIQGVFYGRVEG